MKRSGVFVGWDDAELVEAARGDRPSAYGELFERWYDRCYDVALNICRNGETAADVAQDTFLVCWEQLAQLRDPAAFGGWVLRTTRNRALNRLERERTRSHDSIDTEEPMAVPDTGPGPDAEAERDDRQRLVWTAASALGERDTSLLDLHLRHGLEPSEIAEELSITPNTAYQLLYRLRSRLRDTIGAVLLWREGRPTCHDLAGLVEGKGRFDADAALTIQRHRRRCLGCSAEFLRQTQPELLFSSVPIAVAAAGFKEQARAALVQAGVPVAMPASAPVAATGPAHPATGPTHPATGPGPAVASPPTVGRPPVPGRAVGAVAAGVVLLALLGGPAVVRGHGRPSDQAGGSRPGTTVVALPVQQGLLPTPTSPTSTLPTSVQPPSTSPSVAPTVTTATSGGTGSGSTATGSTATGSTATGARAPGSKGTGSKGDRSKSTGGTAAPGGPTRDVRAGTVPGSGPGAGEGSLPGSGPDGDPVGSTGYRSRMRCPGRMRAREVRVYLTASGELVVTARCGSQARWWLVAPCAAQDVPRGPDVSREPLSRTTCLFSSDRVPAPGPHPHPHPRRR